MDLITRSRMAKAFWEHDGNSSRPHVVLTSGMHSDKYFNGGLIMEDPNLLDILVRELVNSIGQQGLDIKCVDRVVGPAMGAIKLAHQVAYNISKLNGRRCLSSYTEKDHDRMVFRTSHIRRGENILVVEDVLTTGGSVDQTMRAILSEGGRIPAFVGAIVNQTGGEKLGIMKIVSIVDLPPKTWLANECPLCKEGSEALRPAKQKKNWERLNADY